MLMNNCQYRKKSIRYQMFPNDRELTLFELALLKALILLNNIYFTRDDLGFYFLTKREVECGMAFNIWLRFKTHSPYEV